MLTCTRLRIDRADGSVALEYRIESDGVQMRVLPPRSRTRSERVIEWLSLTSDQLRDQVELNPLLARWLERRMGVRRLLRACTGGLPEFAACNGV
jgi:hypothetical protein